MGFNSAFKGLNITKKKFEGDISLIQSYLHRKVFKEKFFHWLLTGWRSWLRHCATTRKVTVSIPDGVTGIFFIDIIHPAALWPWG